MSAGLGRVTRCMLRPMGPMSRFHWSLASRCNTKWGASLPREAFFALMYFSMNLGRGGGAFGRKEGLRPQRKQKAADGTTPSPHFWQAAALLGSVSTALMLLVASAKMTTSLSNGWKRTGRHAADDSTLQARVGR